MVNDSNQIRETAQRSRVGNSSKRTVSTPYSVDPTDKGYGSTLSLKWTNVSLGIFHLQQCRVHVSSYRYSHHGSPAQSGGNLNPA